MRKIKDWNNRIVETSKSKGGIIALVHPFQNLIQTGINPFPPPEIVQKLYKSRQQRAYSDTALAEVTKYLGFYSDLQSIHSEDAITWSVLGTVSHAEQEIQKRYLHELMESLNIPISITSNVSMWLWRRVPHPDTLVSGGPEIDFGIETNDILILGEAKWLSGVGEMQGKKKNKTQIELRKEFCIKYGKVLFPSVSKFVILGVSLSGDIVKNDEFAPNFYMRDLTWKSLCSLQSHPCFEEVNRYLKWKQEYSKVK